MVTSSWTKWWSRRSLRILAAALIAAVVVGEDAVPPTPPTVPPPATSAPVSSTPAAKPDTAARDAATIANNQAVTQANALMAAGNNAEAMQLLESHLRQVPDDELARQTLLSLRIAALEGEIRVDLGEQSKTKNLIVGDPQYEAARARAEAIVVKRLDVVEYFVAENRYPEAVQACNAILKDYPAHPAVLTLKLKVLRQLQRLVMADRGVLEHEHGVRHDEGINSVIDDAIMPREKPKVARTLMIFDQDITEYERGLLKAKLQERIDLIQNGVEVRKVIEMLFAVTGINYIILDQAIGTETLTIHLVNETVETALATVAKLVNVRYNYAAGTVYISSATSDVLETEIIRLDAGLTDVLAQAQLPQFGQATGGNGAGGQGGQGGGLFAPNQQQQQQQQEFTSDLQRFIDQIPDIVVNWPPEGHIYLEPKSNTVYVRGTPASIAEVKRLLHALDYDSVQVLIEARFIEVSESAARELGLNWDEISAQTANGAYSVNKGSINTAPTVPPGVFQNGLTAQIVAIPTNFSQFKVTLRALEQNGKATALAEPKILTLNNAIGMIELAQDISYIESYTTQSQTTQATPVTTNGTVISSSSIFPQPQWQTAQEGIQLRIRPSVARSSDVITLHIVPAVKQLLRLNPVPFTYQPSPGAPLQQLTVSRPDFDTRSLTTLLHIQNGQTIALGGLVKEVEQTATAGVPFLARVPGLGLFFRRDSKQSDRRNLVIFVTANLIDPGGAKVSDEMRRIRDTARVVLPDAVRAEIEGQQKAPAAGPGAGATGAAPGGAAQPAATSDGKTAADKPTVALPWERGRGR